MADEQAQNGAPDAPQASPSDVENGAVEDTTPTPDTPTPQTASTPPSEPLLQAEANATSEPAQPVSEPEPAPKPAEPVPNEPIEAKPPETPTAQIPANEPLPQNDEPLDIPPFDNSPTPLPKSPVPTGAPAPSPARAGRSGRDLLVKARATIQERKQKKLEKILELLSKKEKVTNDDVEKLLHVSDATATRYLSALEKEGAIKQVGKTGKAVVYTRV